MSKKVKGVALALLAQSGRILAVCESETSKWKKRGDWSVPMETAEPNESFPSAFARLFREEAPAGVSVPFWDLTFIGSFDILQLAEVDLYLGDWDGEELCHPPEAPIGDVGAIEWVSIEELLCRKCRPGVKDMLEAVTRYLNVEAA